MYIFNLAMSQWVIQACGLSHPEKFQFHAFTRRGYLTSLLNFLLGRRIPYLVWGHDVHLTGLGLYLLDHDSLSSTDLRSLLQETERSSWKAFRMSLRRRANDGSALLGRS